MDLFLFATSTTVSLYLYQKDRKRKAAAAKTQVVSLGLLCLDIHATPVDALPQGGGVEFVDKIHLSCAGTSGGTVVTLAKLGLSTAILGCLGASDDNGQYLLNKLHSLGVSTKGIQCSSTKPTSATVINVRSNGDRPCLHQRGASDDLNLAHDSVMQQIIECNPHIIHIGGLGLFPKCLQEQTLPGFLQTLTKQSCKPTIVRGQ